MKRALLLLTLLLLVAAGWLIARSAGLDLATLRIQVAAVEAWSAEHRTALMLGFFLGYVLVTALSLPIAVWLTLAAGALFGFWQGLILVSFAASIGATLAFLAARHLLADWVRTRLGRRGEAVQSGLDRDGAFYLFSLRLIPVVPFFVLNLVMGLTRMPALRFYWVSQLGMLAGTAVYVNAGTQLGTIEQVADIVSPSLLLSFALLAAFPWLARRALTAYSRHRLYRRWRRPRRFDRNLVVIGAGAAGLVSAYVAAASRASVTLVEAQRMGGDCLNTGCVPSKALIRSATMAERMRHADRYGLHPVEQPVDFPAVMERVRAVIAAIAPHDSVERYTALGVDVRQGMARLIDPWTVEIESADGSRQRLSTRAVIIAAGAAPVLPPIPGLDAVQAVTSDTLWEALANRDRAPGRLIVLGGGPIGSELAQAFARLGSSVTLVERGERLLPQEDPDVSAHARKALERDGVRVLTGHTALRCGTGSGDWIELTHAGTSLRLELDLLLVAVGREARLQGFGLETLGIATDRVVQTNAWLETLYPNILAAGDVAGPYQFTHAAGHQAWTATVNALFGQLWRFRADHRIMPRATFIDPEVARVGLSEQEATAQGIAVTVSRYGIDDLDRALADSSADGFVKVLTVPGKDRILGVTIVGPHASDLLAEFVLAMSQGLGLNRILGTIHAYPTLAEANKLAAGVWRRSTLNPRLLDLLERYHRWRRR